MIERDKPTGITSLVRAFGYSLQGFIHAWREEAAFRQEVYLAAAVIPAGLVLGRSGIERAMLVYPMSAGRNFDEVLRLLDSLQLNAKHAVATPVNWKPGDDVIIPTSVSNDDANKKYPQGFKTLKPYLRYVAQPK